MNPSQAEVALDTIRQFILKSKYAHLVDKFEEKTKVKVELVVAGLGAFLVLLVFFGFGSSFIT